MPTNQQRTLCLQIMLLHDDVGTCIHCISTRMSLIIVLATNQFRLQRQGMFVMSLAGIAKVSMVKYFAAGVGGCKEN